MDSDEADPEGWSLAGRVPSLPWHWALSSAQRRGRRVGDGTCLSPLCKTCPLRCHCPSPPGYCWSSETGPGTEGERESERGREKVYNSESLVWYPGITPVMASPVSLQPQQPSSAGPPLHPRSPGTPGPLPSPCPPAQVPLPGPLAESRAPSWPRCQTAAAVRPAKSSPPGTQGQGRRAPGGTRCRGQGFPPRFPESPS